MGIGFYFLHLDKRHWINVCKTESLGTTVGERYYNILSSTPNF